MIRIHVCVYIYIYTYIHTYTYIYTYVYIYIYVYIGAHLTLPGFFISPPHIHVYIYIYIYNTYYYKQTNSHKQGIIKKHKQKQVLQPLQGLCGPAGDHLVLQGLRRKTIELK